MVVALNTGFSSMWESSTKAVSYLMQELIQDPSSRPL